MAARLITMPLAMTHATTEAGPIIRLERDEQSVPVAHMKAVASPATMLIMRPVFHPAAIFLYARVEALVARKQLHECPPGKSIAATVMGPGGAGPMLLMLEARASTHRSQRRQPSRTFRWRRRSAINGG